MRCLRLLWLVIEDLFNLFDNLRRHFRDDVQCEQLFFQLRCGAGAKDDCASCRERSDERQGKLNDTRVQFILGKLGKGTDLF